MAAELAGIRARRRRATGALRRARAGAGHGVGGAGIMGVQRTRLLTAAVGVLAEQGYAGFTAAAVCERSGVSRRTFYEVFENREQCLAAILTAAERRAHGVIAQIGLERAAWSERVRLGLWAILCLVDEDPELAKVCLVESQRAGAEVQRERERIVAGLVNVLDEGRSHSPGTLAASGLTAEALVGAVSSVIAARLTRSAPVEGAAPGRRATSGRGAASGQRAMSSEGRGAEVGVRGLLGELAAMIVLPYQGPAAARRQIERVLPDVPAPASIGVAAGGAKEPDPLASLPMRLTYRTACVLQAVARLTETGAGASNRQIAERAGISDAGQASKLLGRLARNGLLENAAVGSRERGEANQWHLTETGTRVVRSTGENWQIQ